MHNTSRNFQDEKLTAKIIIMTPGMNVKCKIM